MQVSKGQVRVIRDSRNADLDLSLGKDEAKLLYDQGKIEMVKVYGSWDYATVSRYHTQEQLNQWASEA